MAASHIMLAVKYYLREFEDDVQACALVDDRNDSGIAGVAARRLHPECRASPANPRRLQTSQIPRDLPYKLRIARHRAQP